MKFKKFRKNWFSEPNFSSQGKINYTHRGKTYKLWYGKVGKGDKYPLLVLHGGPGRSHSNLVPLQALGFEREIIFYDQLGCGYSDKPDNPSLWNITRYIEEVKAVVDALGLERFHLIGHSWGGMLATAFTNKYPQGVVSLSLMSPILNMPLYVKKTSIELRKNLPGNYAEIIDAFEREGRGDPEKYKTALMEHLRMHICKSFPNPPEPLTRLDHLTHKQVHDEMLGKNCASELSILGNLRDVDVSKFLKNIDIPILFTCGDIECCPPKDIETYVKKAKTAEYHVFKGCRHMTMMDNPVEFLNVVHEFISNADFNDIITPGFGA